MLILKIFQLCILYEPAETKQQLERTQYLARVRNPHEALRDIDDRDSVGQHGGHGGHGGHDDHGHDHDEDHDHETKHENDHDDHDHTDGDHKAETEK